MKQRLKIISISAATLIFGGVAAQAAVVTLSFSGTYDTGGGTVFGLSGVAVPYTYELTYDTTLDTNALFFPTGAALGTHTTTHEWHGYSVSGITGTSLTFGSQTWTVSDLLPRMPVAGVSADLWFDTDIAVSTPTLSWIHFQSAAGSLTLGDGVSDPTEIFLLSRSLIADDGIIGGLGFSDPMAIQAVSPIPIPAALPLFGTDLGILGFLGWRRRRKAQAV